jgi:hypothetical protein
MLRRIVDLPKRTKMAAPSRSTDTETMLDALRDDAGSLPAFDQDIAAKIGRTIAVRRSLCGLSQQQLGARLGIDTADVDAYERGVRRISCKLLLESAKRLKAHPRFFFQ